MKFTYNWLLDYFEPLCSFEQILDGLLSLGLEVENVKYPIKHFSKTLEGFTVAEILDTKPHENADKLNICKVSTCNGTKEIVCGAPNARKGIKVIFADVGTYIPGLDFTIVEKTIRNVKSCGMLVSEKELNLSDNHDSIIEIHNYFPVGTPASKALADLNDIVIELSVTPNLGHLLSVRNIALSLGALGLGKFKDIAYPDILQNIWILKKDNNNVHKYYSNYTNYKIQKDSTPTNNPSVNIDINNENICSQFIAVKLTNVNLMNSLPSKISSRLKLIEQKLINPIVDITNYLTIDLNHPMHAYDNNTLGNNLIVCYGNSNDALKALDKNNYHNLKDIPIIKTNNQAISIAGIIGGFDFSLSDNSSNILLECAYFSPIEISKAINKLKINTSSSYHFQRGVNPLDLLETINRAVYLIKEYLGCNIEGVYINTNKEFDSTIITTRCSYIEKILGIQINKETTNRGKTLHSSEIINFLNNEGLESTIQDNGNISIKVPPFRYDINTEADIAELILKLYGINNIISQDFTLVSKNREFNTLTTAESSQLSNNNNVLNKDIYDLSLLSKKSLAILGLLETINMSFISENTAKLFNIYNPDLHLSNPISPELSVMRSSLIPSLVIDATNNYHLGYNNITFFEVANIYNSLTSYTMHAAAILSGLNHRKDWRFKSEPYNIFDIKELVFNFLNSMGINLDLLSIKVTSNNLYSYLNQNKCGQIYLNYKNTNYNLGYFGELHPYITFHFNLKYNPVVFELNLQNCLLPYLQSNNNLLDIKPISKFMPLERDFAFIIENSVSASKVIDIVLHTDPLISEVNIFDVYPINNQYKSLGISIIITPINKTLTEAEINNLSDKIIKAIELSTGGRLRNNVNIEIH